jgi:photoactive yellow protein
MVERMANDGMTHSVPDFETPHLAEAIERMTRETIDNLPFGVIRLDAGGKVVFYSDAERRLSGYSKDVLDRPFFAEIAPCMNNAFFKRRIDDALAKGTLNMTFDHIGDFDDAAKALRVRVQSASVGGCWLFLQRED